jgi:hypothetical protein
MSENQEQQDQPGNSNGVDEGHDTGGELAETPPGLNRTTETPNQAKDHDPNPCNAEKRPTSQELRQPLADKDWADVDARFEAQMVEIREQEHAIADEYNQWLKVCPSRWPFTTV